MKIKTKEAIGPALDWMVEKALGTYWSNNGYFIYTGYVKPHGMHSSKPAGSYSADWAHGGPIIEREDIMFGHGGMTEARRCYAYYFNKSRYGQYGKTKLIAAMRCFVASKLGDEVDVPEELT